MDQSTHNFIVYRWINESFDDMIKRKTKQLESEVKNGTNKKYKNKIGFWK